MPPTFFSLWHIPPLVPPTFFSLWHIPPLVVASGHLFGGLIPFFNAPRAMHDYGLPPRIQSSPEAQVVMRAYGSRATLLGLALWTCYWRNMLEAVDVLTMCIGLGGLFDGVIQKELGGAGYTAFRTLLGAGFGVWGFLGMTSKSR